MNDKFLVKLHGLVFENLNETIIYLLNLVCINFSIATTLLLPYHYSIFGVTYFVLQLKIDNYDWAKWKLRSLNLVKL